jgi:hypothetical protein
MNKKGVALIFIGLFVFSLIASIAIVSAAGFWESISGSLSGDGTAKLDDYTQRILFLILIAVLIFSALKSANFPDNVGAQIAISIVVSFLAVVYITPNEFFGIMQSYNALGIALSVFLPVLILIFFTLVVGQKAPFAIVFTKFLWAIFSIQIFWKGLIALFGPQLKIYFASITVKGATEGSKVASTFWTKIAGSSLLTLPGGKAVDPIVAVALMVGGAVLFFIGVMSNKWQEYLREQVTEAQIDNYQDKIKKSMGFVKSNAEAVEDK